MSKEAQVYRVLREAGIAKEDARYAAVELLKIMQKAGY